jgi:hypothetical protein
MTVTARVAVPLLVLLAACSVSHPGSASSITSSTTTAIVRAAAPRPCTRTLSAVRPDRVPAGVGHGRPVVGSGALWTIAAALRLHGDHQTRGWVIKMPWITRPFGIPVITARRLDGVGTFHASADEAIDQNGQWVASNLIFSTAGCWEVTSRFRGSTIRFEVRIGSPER